MGIDGIPDDFSSIENLEEGLKVLLAMKLQLVHKLQGINSPGSRGVINDQLEEVARSEEKIQAKLKAYKIDAGYLKKDGESQ